jgi:hypothetical protein
MTNRIANSIAALQPRIEALDSETRKRLDSGTAIEFDEHFAYQNAQAAAHAQGKLTADEAMIVYRALGAVRSDSNGGWSARTDLATKVIVTKLISELLA